MSARTIGITTTLETNLPLGLGRVHPVLGFGGEVTTGLLYDTELAQYYQIETRGINFGLGAPVGVSDAFVFSNNPAYLLGGSGIGLEASALIGININIGVFDGAGTTSGSILVGADVGFQAFYGNSVVTFLSDAQAQELFPLKFDALQEQINSNLDYVSLAIENQLETVEILSDVELDSLLVNVIAEDGTTVIQSMSQIGETISFSENSEVQIVIVENANSTIAYNGILNTDNIIAQTSFNENGETTVTTHDPLNLNLWDTTTTVIDSDGNIITNIQDYDFTGFDTNPDLTQYGAINFTEAQAAAFVDNYERTVYAGDNQAGGLPGVFAFDNAFSPLHSYQTGYYSFNDGGAEFVDGEWDISYDTVQYIDYTDDYYADFYDTNSEVYYGGQYDYDTSSYDYNYEDWNAEAYFDQSFESFPTYTMDGHDSSYSYQPVILDLDGNGVTITPREQSGATFDTEHGQHKCAAVMRLRHATNQKRGDSFDENTAPTKLEFGPNDGLLVLNATANDNALLAFAA